MKANPSHVSQSAVSWLTLFTSAGTLICCALPILFVMLGLGASVAAVTSTVPLLVTLAVHKIWVFAGSGLMLLVSGWLLYRPGRACPSDPERARISHHPSAADADPLAVTGRTPSSRLDVVSATPAPSSGPCTPPQRRLDALATKGGEKCGLGRLCGRAERWNRRIHGFSVAIWGIGFVAAYLALPIRMWLGV